MFASQRIRIGSRVIKTAVSSSITVFMTESLGLSFHALGIVAAVMTMQPTFHETLDMAKRRLLGTLIGTAISIPFVYFLSISSVFEIFSGVFIILVAANIFKLHTSSILGIMAFASIVTMPDATYFSFLDRIFVTLIGSGVSLILNSFLPVMPIAKNTENTINSALMLDLKLLDENLKLLIGKSDLKDEDIRLLSVEAVEKFNAAYSMKAVLHKEQRYDTDNELFEAFDEKHHSLWLLHNSVHHIRISQAKFLENELSISSAAAVTIAAFCEILDEILRLGYVPCGINRKLLESLEEIEKAVTGQVVSEYNVSSYDEASFYVIFIFCIKNILDNIGIFEVDRAS